MDDFQTAAEKAANARSKAALGTEFAVDHVIVKGVKFYYQQVAHAWALPLLQELDQFSAGLAALYVLAHDADTVRNVVIPEIWNGSIREKAIQFFIDKNLLPEDLAGLDKKLLQHPYSSGEKMPATQ